MKYQRCKVCHRHKVWNDTYGMCEDCLKESAERYGFDICDNCDGSSEMCFCGNGFMKKEKLEGKE